MFQIRQRKTALASGLGMIELIYHATVRHIRKSHGNAVIGLLMNMLQTLLMVLIFYVMFELLSLRRIAIRGDFLLYVMSGVFLFVTHTKTVAAVSAAEGPTSPMMKHAPMNTLVAIASAAFATLYIQILSAAIVLFLYHAVVRPITVFDWPQTFGLFSLAWFAGVGIGMLLMSARPWAPELVTILTTVYQRMNMIASGKMFVVNTLPASMVALFDWNPLFHIIDQARGAIFLNYNPHYTSVRYAVYVTLVCLMLGLMLEFYTRRHASLSWTAGR